MDCWIISSRRPSLVVLGGCGRPVSPVVVVRGVGRVEGDSVRVVGWEISSSRPRGVVGGSRLSRSRGLVGLLFFLLRYQFIRKVDERVLFDSISIPKNNQFRSNSLPNLNNLANLVP